MLFAEWESLMHLSFDDNGKGNDIEKDVPNFHLFLEIISLTLLKNIKHCLHFRPLTQL